MNKAVFLDRDGTINIDKGYVYKLEDLEFLPGACNALKAFQDAGFTLIVITNQSGVGRGYYTMKDVEKFNNYLNKKLNSLGINITDFFICPHKPEDSCNCRKPSPYLINEAIRKYNIDPQKSFMFGDKSSDVQLGENANIQSYLITEKENLAYWANKLL